jgi:hypothetical protein
LDEPLNPAIASGGVDSTVTISGSAFTGTKPGVKAGFVVRAATVGPALIALLRVSSVDFEILSSKSLVIIISL